MPRARGAIGGEHRPELDRRPARAPRTGRPRHPRRDRSDGAARPSRRGACTRRGRRRRGAPRRADGCRAGRCAARRSSRWRGAAWWRRRRNGRDGPAVTRAAVRSPRPSSSRSRRATAAAVPWQHALALDGAASEARLGGAPVARQSPERRRTVVIEIEEVSHPLAPAVATLQHRVGLDGGVGKRGRRSGDEAPGSARAPARRRGSPPSDGRSSPQAWDGAGSATIASRERDRQTSRRRPHCATSRPMPATRSAIVPASSAAAASEQQNVGRRRSRVAATRSASGPS